MGLATPPELVICLGLAAGTDTIRLERVALNLRDARIPDNAGAQPADVPVVPQGPPALFSTLRLKAAHARITATGIPVTLSLSAGSYVCNELLYTALHHISAKDLQIPAGFVHLPDLHSPSTPLSIGQAAAAVDLLIAESLRKNDDDATPLGQLH